VRQLVNTVSWGATCLLTVYLIGGVLFYFDLRFGMGVFRYLPEPVFNFLLIIYGIVFLLLGNIWPEHFPFFH
jgi:hypothetical protein